MPFCNTSKPGEASSSADNGIKIFYQTYGHGKTKVLLIIGLAGTHDSWGPQIKALAGTDMPNEDDSPHVPDYENEDGIEVCAFDNRGMGRSSVPTKKSEYTTLIMAKDALALMDHLGWKKAHVFGHSMGAMIACKLAAIAPDRISSLALLNVTGGGFECFPKVMVMEPCSCRFVSYVALTMLHTYMAYVDNDVHTFIRLEEKTASHVGG